MSNKIEDYKEESSNFEKNYKSKDGGISNISVETRKLIDIQLIKIASINLQIGKDTKADDKIEYRRQIGACLKEIKRLDKGFYDEIVPVKSDKT